VGYSYLNIALYFINWDYGINSILSFSENVFAIINYHIRQLMHTALHVIIYGLNDTNVLSNENIGIHYYQVIGILSATSIVLHSQNPLKSLAVGAPPRTRWGSLRRSPRLPSRPCPLPRPHPLGACRALIHAPSALASAPTAPRFSSPSKCAPLYLTPSAAPGHRIKTKSSAYSSSICRPLLNSLDKLLALPCTTMKSSGLSTDALLSRPFTLTTVVASS